MAYSVMGVAPKKVMWTYARVVLRWQPCYLAV